MLSWSNQIGQAKLVIGLAVLCTLLKRLDEAEQRKKHATQIRPQSTPYSVVTNYSLVVSPRPVPDLGALILKLFVRL